MAGLTQLAHLLDTEARRAGDAELVQEVTRLGIVYNLVTPYTTFLAVPASLQTAEVKEQIRAGKRGYDKKLVDTLQGKGPFTVFAPVNAAFAALPAGTVESLLEPGNKMQLTKVLTYHVVAGRLTASEIDRLIEKGNGTATLTTVSGGKLWLMKNGSRNITIKDESGATADIAIYDVMQSNGVIHSIDKVLLPM